MADSSLLGYIAILIAVLGFGSNFVPLKRIRIGDGVFFQFCMCNAIFLISGVPILLIQDFPPVHGIAIFGGLIWCTGNIICPTIVKFIGMGLGLILWGSSSLVCGWASGTFGLFGLKKQPVSNPALNYAGVALSIVGLFLYLQVKTNDTNVDTNTSLSDATAAAAATESDGAKSGCRNYDDKSDSGQEIGEEYSLIHYTDIVDEESTISDTPNQQLQLQQQNERDREAGYSVTQAVDEPTVGLNIGDRWTEEQRRVAGLFLAILNGCLVGFSFDPSQYVIDHKYDGRDDSLNYVFSQFLGIFLSSWAYLLLYILYCKSNQIVPYINHDVFLPATFSGAIWSVAMVCWFIANGRLGFPITFPIVSAGPGFVGALWGIFVFREISGTRNLLMLCVAAGVTIPALIMVALSH